MEGKISKNVLLMLLMSVFVCGQTAMDLESRVVLQRDILQGDILPIKLNSEKKNTSYSNVNSLGVDCSLSDWSDDEDDTDILRRAEIERRNTESDVARYLQLRVAQTASPKFKSDYQRIQKDQLLNKEWEWKSSVFSSDGEEDYEDVFSLEEDTPVFHKFVMQSFRSFEKTKDKLSIRGYWEMHTGACFEELKIKGGFELVFVTRSAGFGGAYSPHADLVLSVGTRQIARIPCRMRQDDDESLYFIFSDNVMIDGVKLPVNGLLEQVNQ